MAKSKSGGTRSYLRGRIASDVYSIGRDSSGKKQQVVRSLAEQVANPQTIAQMRGRMIMSTVMQAVSSLAPIIDHSFDGIPTGQPSISEFIRKNYALIKADVEAHPASGNTFALSPYQVKGIQKGAYLISNGNASQPSAMSLQASSDFGLEVFFSSETPTVADLKEAWELGTEGYVTVVAFTLSRTANFFRARFKGGLSDDTALSADNIGSLFEIEDPFNNNVQATFASGMVKIGSNVVTDGTGIVITRYEEGKGFYHSTAFMRAKSPVDGAADTVLPTYPVGEERFLNGGEL